MGYLQCVASVGFCGTDGLKLSSKESTRVRSCLLRTPAWAPRRRTRATHHRPPSGAVVAPNRHKRHPFGNLQLSEILLLCNDAFQMRPPPAPRPLASSRPLRRARRPRCQRQRAGGGRLLKWLAPFRGLELKKEIGVTGLSVFWYRRVRLLLPPRDGEEEEERWTSPAASWLREHY